MSGAATPLNAPRPLRSLMGGLGLVSVLATGMLATGALAQSQDAAQPDMQQGQRAAQPAPLSDAMRQTLQGYGSFVAHARYGEVWVPSSTTVPMGWHPYPACYWVNSAAYGWYVQDPTAWGAIVHHYGRWTHDDQMGWVWVPGAEFSPGWVVWRTSASWVGWAPTPPEQDVGVAESAAFNGGDQWTFMATSLFGHGCGTPAAPQLVSGLIGSTTLVTDIRTVGGIAVFVLPVHVTGPVVNVTVTFDPWTSFFFAKFVTQINWVWNHLTVTVVHVACTLPGPNGGGGTTGIGSTPPTSIALPTPPRPRHPRRPVDITPPAYALPPVHIRPTTVDVPPVHIRPYVPPMAVPPMAVPPMAVRPYHPRLTAPVTIRTFRPLPEPRAFMPFHPAKPRFVLPRGDRQSPMPEIH